MSFTFSLELQILNGTGQPLGPGTSGAGRPVSALAEGSTSLASATCEPSGRWYRGWSEGTPRASARRSLSSPIGDGGEKARRAAESKAGGDPEEVLDPGGS